MNQLGIIYRLTASEQGKGFDAYVLESNENLDGWRSAVTDERDTWAAAGMEANNAIAMTILKSGIILTASRLTHGTRPTDNMAIWVYIQSSLKVTADQWMTIISEMHRIVSMPQLPTLASYNTLQSMDFPVRTYKINHQPSDLSLTNHKLACRIYSSPEQLVEILDNVDQKDYPSYKHIFLYGNNPAGIQRQIDNLSSMPLTKYHLAVPPTPDVVAQTFNNPHIQLYYNGSPFNGPQLVKSTQIQLEARRNGCEPIPVAATVNPDEMPVTLLTDGPAEFHYIIKRQDISVVDESGKSIDRTATVKVMGTQLNNLHDLKLREQDQNRIALSINAAGFEPFEETVTLSRLSQPFRLKARKETINTNVSLNTIEGKTTPVALSLTGCNLGRLESQDITLHVEKGRMSIAKSGDFMKGLLTGIAGCVLLGLLVWGGIFAYTTFFGENKPTTPGTTDNDDMEILEEPVNPPSEGENIGNLTEPGSNDADYSQAVNYLQVECRTTDGQDFCLDKDQMANYPALVNVYDYVNTGNVDALTELGELSQIEPLRSIISKLKEMQTRGFEFSNVFSGGYSSNGKIQVSNFKKRIDEKMIASRQAVVTHKTPAPAKAANNNREKQGKSGKSTKPAKNTLDPRSL